MGLLASAASSPRLIFDVLQRSPSEEPTWTGGGEASPAGTKNPAPGGGIYGNWGARTSPHKSALGPCGLIKLPDLLTVETGLHAFQCRAVFTHK